MLKRRLTSIPVALATCAAALCVAASSAGAATASAAVPKTAKTAATTTTAPAHCEPTGASHLAYSTNLDSNYDSVSVIDTNTQQVVRSLPGFNIPANVTPTNDGSLLYVDNWDTALGDTDIVNPCSGAVEGTIARPGGVFPLTNISKDGKYVYLSAVQGFEVEQLDAQTGQVLRTYSTLATGEPIGYAVPSPDGKTLWIAGLTNVYTMSLATGKLIGNPIAIPSGLSPEWLGFTPDGSRIISTNFVGGTDTIINTATRKVIGTVNSGINSYPNSASATPDSSQFWVGNLDGTIDVINAQTGTLVKTMTAGKLDLDVTFSPNGQYAYADSEPSSSPAPNLNGAVTAFGFIITGLYHPGPGIITVYNTHNYQVVKRIPTGGIPSPLITPPGPFSS